MVVLENLEEEEEIRCRLAYVLFHHVMLLPCSDEPRRPLPDAKQMPGPCTWTWQHLEP